MDPLSIQQTQAQKLISEDYYDTQNFVFQLQSQKNVRYQISSELHKYQKHHQLQTTSLVQWGHGGFGFSAKYKNPNNNYDLILGIQKQNKRKLRQVYGNLRINKNSPFQFRLGYKFYHNLANAELSMSKTNQHFDYYGLLTSTLKQTFFLRTFIHLNSQYHINTQIQLQKQIDNDTSVFGQFYSKKLNYQQLRLGLSRVINNTTRIGFLFNINKIHFIDWVFGLEKKVGQTTLKGKVASSKQLHMSVIRKFGIIRFSGSTIFGHSKKGLEWKGMGCEIRVNN